MSIVGQDCLEKQERTDTSDTITIAQCNSGSILVRKKWNKTKIRCKLSLSLLRDFLNTSTCIYINILGPHILDVVLQKAKHEDKEDLNLRDKSGNTALHVVCKDKWVCYYHHCQHVLCILCIFVLEFIPNAIVYIVNSFKYRLKI